MEADLTVWVDTVYSGFKNFKDLKNILENAIDYTNDYVINAHNEIETLESNNKKLEEENDELKSQLEDKENYIKELLNEIEELKNQGE